MHIIFFATASPIACHSGAILLISGDQMVFLAEIVSGVGTGCGFCFDRVDCMGLEMLSLKKDFYNSFVEAA